MLRLERQRCVGIEATGGKARVLECRASGIIGYKEGGGEWGRIPDGEVWKGLNGDGVWEGGVRRHAQKAVHKRVLFRGERRVAGEHSIKELLAGCLRRLSAI